MSPRPRGPSRTGRLPSDAELTRYGAQIRRIRTSRAEVDWMQGPGPTDLWIWYGTDGEVSHVELGFASRIVRLTAGVLATGRSQEAVGSSYAQTDLVELDPALDPDTVRAARCIVDAVPNEVRNGPIIDLVKALSEVTTPNI